MASLRNLAETVEKRIPIRTTPRDVESILSCLQKSSHFWEVVYLAQRPFAMVSETIRALIQEGLAEALEDGTIRLTAEGRLFIAKERISPKKHYPCLCCERRGIDLSEFSDLIREFDALTVDRPKPVIDYDQGHATTRTVLARIALMAEKGDLAGKKLLVLGDDDLVSLAAGMSGLPEEVVVLEIDERIVRYINDKARCKGLPIKAFEYDFRQTLPDDLVGAFDTFTTDPPETLEALELVITRGLAGLKGEGCAGYFGLTRTESSLNKWWEFQKLLLCKFNVAITDILEDFNHYVNWDYLLDSVGNDYKFVHVEPKLNWYRSSMYRIETVSRPSAIDNNPKARDCELYVDGEALVYRPSHVGNETGGAV